jgi:hypothetical protein
MHCSKLFLDGVSACKNAIRTRRRAFATRRTRRRRTVAQTSLRLAAGVVVVAGCLLVGGPSAAVAIAGPGDGGSDTRRGTGGSDRAGSDWSDNNISSGSRGSTTNTETRPTTRVGSGRESGTSDERPSADFSPDPAGQSRSPKVTFGDGRTPGVQDRDPGPRWRWRAPEPAPPPPPPEVITVPLTPPNVSPVRHEPGVVQQLVVAPTSGLGDPLWGVAGLLLIPAAGAILGYRQARGAHAAAELGRHP